MGPRGATDKLKCLIFCSLLVGCGAGSVSAQTLYNGIVLPQPWPPVRTPTQVYQVPYYITTPPAVIPIDVGRQLFVDDFLIQQTTLTRTFHQPVMYGGNPILSPSPSDTQNLAIPYSDGAWFDSADQTFKMWYYCGGGNKVCYAYSADGISWSKPSLANAVVPGTNQVLQIGSQRNSDAVWMDLNDPDPAAKFKAFAYYPPGNMLVYFSPDGITWTQQTQYSIQSLSDRTTLFYNPFRKIWVDSLRWRVTLPATQTRASYFSRTRFYAESPDLVAWTPTNFTDSFWIGPDDQDPPYNMPGGAIPELYNLDAVPYESLMVGLFSWFYPKTPDIVELGVGFSRDGFYWVRPSRTNGPDAFIPASNTSGTWNLGNTQSAGGCFLIVGNELWFYFTGRNAPHSSSPVVGSTGLATLRRDGFYSMDAGPTSGVLTTRSIQFSGNNLFVNVNDPAGNLQVNVLNPTDGQILATSTPLSVDSTKQQVTWNGLNDLSSLAGQPVQFQFTVTNGELYSFWVTNSAIGSSNGYVAAGGPGFSGAVDVDPGAVTRVATPLITPPGGVFTGPVTVSLNTVTNGATIRYTLDGSLPIDSSAVYLTPFQLTNNGTVNVIATKMGSSNSGVGTASFTITQPPADFTISIQPLSQSVASGSGANYVASVSARNGFIGTVNLSVSGLPAGAAASFTPTTITGSGNSTLSVTTVSTTPAGISTLIITGTCGSLTHSTNSSLTVAAAAGGSALQGYLNHPTGMQNLTVLGTADWAHWGLTSNVSFDHKAGTTSQISNWTVVNGEAGQVARKPGVGSPLSYIWTNGAPTSAMLSTTTGLYIVGQNRGLQIHVPADTTTRTLTLYVGVSASRAKVIAHLSDNSSMDYVDTSFSNLAAQTGAYTFAYSARSAGQTLTVTITGNSAVGNVQLFAAVLH